jgi:hypothetical protein
MTDLGPDADLAKRKAAELAAFKVRLWTKF